MRFVHSFSTIPIGLEMYGKNAAVRLFGNVIYYAASVLYLKKLNQEIVLHTDSLGKFLLEFLPYDSIYLTCDEMPADISPRFWACAKMLALEAEPIGSIHIDGDVFIKKQKCIDEIKKISESADCIVQYLEEQKSWYKKICRRFWDNIEVCESYGLDMSSENLAYNTGTFGFFNEELKRKFLDSYFGLARFYSGKYSDLRLKQYETPDLICEQKLIYDLTNQKYKVGTLLDLWDKTGKSSEIGYQHVITVAKFNQLDKCMKVIQSLDSEIYQRLKTLYKNILKF